MRFLPRPGLLLVAALALTLPLKFQFHDSFVPGADDGLGTALSAFFSRHGFQSRSEVRPSGLFVHATAGDCRLLVTESAAQGWNLDSIELYSAGFGRLAFVFDGSVYSRQPLVGTIFDGFWTRLRQRMGFHPARHPVLAVAAAGRCELERLPWREVAEVA